MAKFKLTLAPLSVIAERVKPSKPLSCLRKQSRTVSTRSEEDFSIVFSKALSSFRNNSMPGNKPSGIFSGNNSRPSALLTRNPCNFPSLSKKQSPSPLANSTELSTMKERRPILFTFPTGAPIALGVRFDQISGSRPCRKNSVKPRLNDFSTCGLNVYLDLPNDAR